MSVKIPDRAKWAAPRDPPAKVRPERSPWTPANLTQGHGDCIFTACGERQVRIRYKYAVISVVRRLRFSKRPPSDGHSTFEPRSRDTANMQSIELVAILVATSDFQSFFWGPLRAPKEPPGSGKSSVQAPSSPRLSSKNKHGPGRASGKENGAELQI